MHTHLIGILAILLYLSATGLLALRLAGYVRLPGLGRPSVLGIGFAAVVLHAGALYPLLISKSGLNIGIFNAASLIGLLTASLLLLASLKRPLENLGLVILPFAALTIALMFAYPSRHLLSAQSSWQLDLHVLLSLIAYSLLGIAAVQSILLAIQDHQLKNRHPGGLIRALPPLQVMEDLLFQMIYIGFALLTLALLSGFFFLENIFAQHLVHKTVLSITAWGVFAVLIWGRWKFGWRGRSALKWTLGGFVFLLLAYFGSKFVLEVVLQ